MTTATPAEFEFSFLEEGFSARDVVEQKINESSMTVSFLCDQCHQDGFVICSISCNILLWEMFLLQDCF